METTVSLSDVLFEDAEQFAKRLGISRDELYATAIQEYLRTHREEGVTEALNRIYQEEPSELDPVLASIQAASLPRDNDGSKERVRGPGSRGGKPKGVRGIAVRGGEPVSETIIRDRR